MLPSEVARFVKCLYLAEFSVTLFESFVESNPVVITALFMIIQHFDSEFCPRNALQNFNLATKVTNNQTPIKPSVLPYKMVSTFGQKGNQLKGNQP